jgi:sugar/nucleoside kinase (ribokinase family)
MRYIVAAMTIVNDLHKADGTVIPGVIGGGVYCLGGVKPFCDDVVYVTVAGDDFEDYYGEVFHKSGYTTAGVYRRLPMTHHNKVVYRPDGRWREFSLMPPAMYEASRRPTQITGADVARFGDENTRGIYTESGLEELFWTDAELGKMRAAAPGAKMLWELPYNNVFVPEQRARFPENVRKCDIYSINESEGRVLFGVETRKEVIRAILELGVPCFFRCGADGAAIIMQGRVVRGPGIGIANTVDPTGCGNCSTTAALYGYAEGLEPLEIVAGAGVAAAYNAMQPGPYPAFTPAVRAKIQKETKTLAARLLREYGRDGTFGQW